MAIWFQFNLNRCEQILFITYYYHYALIYPFQLLFAVAKSLPGDFRPAIQKLGNSEDASVYYAACFWTDAW